MIKKTVTYEDWDGSQKTGEFYFNLTKSELFEFNAAFPNGFPAYAEETLANGSQADTLQLFKDIIRASYGEKHDGVFLKKPDYTLAFLASDAYSSLLISLMSNLDEAVAFFNGIMPKSIQDELQKQDALKDIPGLEQVKIVKGPAEPEATTTITQATLLKLPFDEPANPEPKDIQDMSVEELRAELEKRIK